jgi:hypothetical protein
MGSKAYLNYKKAKDVPKGVAWVPHSVALLRSEAWRNKSTNCGKLLEFLEVDYMQHAGKTNGSLIATYDQLAKWGIPRRYVHKAILEAEALGLIQVEHGGRKFFDCSYVSKFTLTYLRVRVADKGGDFYIDSPNDWQRITVKNITDIREKLGIKSKSRVINVNSHNIQK